MLAAIYEGPGRLEVREVPRPECSEDGLVIRVNACAICGTDVRILASGQANVTTPGIIGHEITGVVEEVGPRTVGFRVGDRVAARPNIPCGRCRQCLRGMQNFCTGKDRRSFGYLLPGGFAEYMHVPEQAIRVGAVFRVPDDADLDEVTIFEPFGCVVNGQEMVAPTVGDTVAIVGAGPVGCFHLALAKMRGASKTVLVDLLASRLGLAERFGPDATVDSSREDPVKRVLEETDGQGADVVIVACSAHRPQEQALEMAARGGRVSYFAGLPHDRPTITFNSNLLHYKQLALYGVTGANFRQHDVAFDLLARRQVDGRTLITHKLPLADILEGFRTVREGEGLKVLIKPSPR
jgi:L-iditol 2-dehydrogenase